MNISWLSESWRTLWPTPWVDLLLAVVAVACGIILGMERQRREKPAGLRTMTLVCLGSAVFTMLSFVFSSHTADSGRVAAQIVTGIGFLGAGVILHGRRTISGMTTAAGIWMAAAIGMAVGAGYAIAGLGLSILVSLLLTGFFFYETRWHPDLRHAWVTLEFYSKGGVTRIRLERILVDYNLAGASAEWSELSGDVGRLTLSAKLARVHLYELLTELVDVPEVHSIKEQSSKISQTVSS